MPRMEEIGRVTGFFAQRSVAVVVLSQALQVGDSVYIKGHTTDFQQVVESMQIERESVESAHPGQTVGLKVLDRCRRHDVVFKLIP